MLPNGVDPGKFKLENTGFEIRNHYKISNEDVLIGFVGWFAEWDRLDKLIGIFKNISSSLTNIKLMIVGDGHIRTQLQQLAENMDIAEKIIITGAIPREEVQKYISAIDIGVLPHSNEFGSPIVLFEFMAMGKPVVAPALDPITDVIENNHTGLIFQPEDFVAMKDALLRLVEDENLRIKIGKSARTEIINNHTWKKKAEIVLKTMEKWNNPG